MAGYGHQYLMQHMAQQQAVAPHIPQHQPQHIQYQQVSRSFKEKCDTAPSSPRPPFTPAPEIISQISFRLNCPFSLTLS